MLIKFDGVANEHVELINRYSVISDSNSHLKEGNLSFWIQDDELPISEIIKMYHQGIQFKYLVAYILIKEDNADKLIPLELGYGVSTWREMVAVTAPDGLYHIAYTNAPNGNTTVEQLMILEHEPSVELLSVAEYQHRTHSWYNDEPFFTISKINAEWRKYFDDYAIARSYMKELMVAAGGFVALPLEEQKIVAKWKCTTTSDIIRVLSEYELQASEALFQKHSTAANKLRIAKCQYLLKKCVNPSDLPVIIQDITKYNLIESFTERLVQGTETVNHDGIQDREGVLDYINAIAGTSFESTGLKVSPVTVNGYTKEQICYMLSNMIKKGSFI
jgi:hypothetical protein